MKNIRFLTPVFLVVLTLLWSCDKESPITDQSETEFLLRGKPEKKGKPPKENPPACTAIDYCVLASGNMTSCNTVSNCAEDAMNRITISSSAGPDNSNAEVVISTLIFADCTLSPTTKYTGPMVIENDGSLTFYYRNDKDKYVLTASADSDNGGEWPDISFSYSSANNGKDGKSDSDCLGNFDFNATITVSSGGTCSGC
jgi:hypothetical protein